MELEKRLAEIRGRKAEIRKALQDGTVEDLDAVNKELEDLETEVRAMERRQAMLAGLADAPATRSAIPVQKPTAPEVTFTRDNVLASPEYRSAFAKTLMCLPLTEAEQRAAGVALTTTATTYVGATASPDVDGVNNAGLFIPTSLNLALMQTLSLMSPIFRDAQKFAIPGVLKFPYRKGGTGAAVVAEGTANVDGQVEWGELTLGSAEVSETIRVSWKLEAMAVDQFMSYLESELVDAVADKTITEMIYGAGGTAALTGATVGAEDVEYTGDPLDAIEEALGKLTPKLKVGAKIYVSNSIVELISFQKNADGGYIFSPINGMGVNSIATYPVEVDPYLAAGDFLIGNMNRYYKFNTVESITVAKDSSGKKRINDYTGYAIFGGAPQPGCFAYGTLDD